MPDELMHYGVLGMKWGVRKDGMPQGYQGNGSRFGRSVKRAVTNPDYAIEKKAANDRKATRKNKRAQIKKINKNENDSIRKAKRDRKAAKKARYRSAKSVSTTGEKALSAGLSIVGGLAVAGLVNSAVTTAVSGVGAGTGSPELMLAGTIIGAGSGAVAGILATRGINEVALPAIVGEPKK